MTQNQNPMHIIQIFVLTLSTFSQVASAIWWTRNSEIMVLNHYNHIRVERAFSKTTWIFLIYFLSLPIMANNIMNPWDHCNKSTIFTHDCCNFFLRVFRCHINITAHDSPSPHVRNSNKSKSMGRKYIRSISYIYLRWTPFKSRGRFNSLEQLRSR